MTTANKKGPRTEFDEDLSRIYEEHEGVGQDLKFLSTVFGFLQRKNKFFDRSNTTKLVRVLMKKHVDRAAEEAEKVKEKEREGENEQTSLKEDVVPLGRNVWTLSLTFLFHVTNSFPFLSSIACLLFRISLPLSLSLLSASLSHTTLIHHHRKKRLL